MDDDTNPVVSPFSGTSTDAAPPPAATPVTPAAPSEPPANPSSNQPPWHAPSLPTEPEPAVPIPAVPPTPTPSEPPLPPVVEPEAPASSFPPPPKVEPSFPPPPPEKPPEAPLSVRPKKSSAGKAIAFVLIFFILAVGGVFGYLTVQQGGLPFNILRKAAEQCGGKCSPTTWGQSWSTCNTEGRWGCDANCNYQDLPDDWCEGTTHKHCSGGNVTSESNDPDCGGSGTQPTQPPSTGQKCPNGGHQECYDLRKCNKQGGCDPACCQPDTNTCPSGQTCDIQNGNCDKGYSCNDSGTPGQHKECVGVKCVNVGGAGLDKCTSDTYCQANPPTQPPAEGCPAGYSADPSCTAGGPQCKTAGGACCQKDGIPYCCYKDGNCYRGGYGNQCKDNGNGSITLTGPMTDVRVFKVTGTNVSCPFSSSNQQNLPESPVTLAAGVTKTLFLGGNECGQIDAVGFCGSCKPGCGPPTTPSPTPTGGQQPCCTNLTLAKVLPDGTVGPLTDLAVGDKIRVTLTFSGTVENVAVRIKKGGVKMIDKLAGGSKTNTWSTDFTLSTAGEYTVLGFVKVGGIWK